MSKHIPIVLPVRKLPAILEHHASQLRVPLKPQPPAHLTAFYGPSKYRKGFEFYDDNHQASPEIRKYPEVLCPYGKRGDLLYVQEEWSTTGERSQDRILKSRHPLGLTHGRLWQPPATMPKEIAQYWLKVTEVKLERLQSISKADALAEGPTRYPEGDQPGFAPAYVNQLDPGGSPCLGARVAFQQWWKLAHGVNSWSANPWVFVVCFQPTLVH